MALVAVLVFMDMLLMLPTGYNEGMWGNEL
jgi:hypothetical protein